MEQKQIKANFNPTAEEVAFANAYITTQGNISKACEIVGDLHRNKYYGSKGLRYKEGFEIWLSEYVKKEIMKREGKWYLVAEKYAEAGSYKHLELLFTLARKLDKPDLQPTRVINIIQSYAVEKKDDTDAPKNPPPKL